MSEDFNLPVGPFHPLLEEAEYFKITLDGEKVKEIEMETGWMHRAIEKLSESNTFDQTIFLVERICGICSASHPFACVNALEDIGNVEMLDILLVTIHFGCGHGSIENPFLKSSSSLPEIEIITASSG